MNKKAQGITEYALIIAAVAAALLVMQPYFKRAVQSIVKTPVDNLGLFGATHTDLMGNADYAKFVKIMTDPKTGSDPCDPNTKECQDKLRAQYIQKIAINQELDPKYGALQGYLVRTTADHSLTMTTPPKVDGKSEGDGQKKTTITKWEDKTQDIPYTKDGQVVTGRVFYQELKY